MGKHVAGEQEVAALFRLLNRISDGYEPTGPEWAALNEVEGIAFSFRETRKTSHYEAWISWQTCGASRCSVLTSIISLAFHCPSPCKP